MNKDISEQSVEHNDTDTDLFTIGRRMLEVSSFWCIITSSCLQWWFCVRVWGYTVGTLSYACLVKCCIILSMVLAVCWWPGWLYTRDGVNTWQHVCCGWDTGHDQRLSGSYKAQHTSAVLWYNFLPRHCHTVTTYLKGHQWCHSCTLALGAWAPNNWEPRVGSKVASATNRSVNGHFRCW